MNNVISLAEFRKDKERVKAVEAKRIEKYNDLTKQQMSDSTEFNYRFYQLVDAFLAETYPEYAWRFDIWLNELEKTTKTN